MSLAKTAITTSLCLAAGSAMAADFVMNFQSSPDKNGAPSYVCNRDGRGACIAYGGYLSFEPTPFLMEEVTVGGVNYIHIIVGDPAQGFAQEVFLEGTNSTTASTYGGASTYSPAENHPTRGTPGQGPLTGPGNASANPERVTVRQVIGGEWDAATNTWSCGAATFCNEFLKDSLALKPRITQTVIDGTMTSFFDMDMRTIGYKLAPGQTLADMATAPIVNDVTLSDMETGNFSMTPQYLNDSKVSAGRYIYTDGAGNLGAEGTYTYEEGYFDAANEDWTIYRDPDPAVNPEINL